jgi:hypothetical protein
VTTVLVRSELVKGENQRHDDPLPWLGKWWQLGLNRPHGLAKRLVRRGNDEMNLVQPVALIWLECDETSERYAKGRWQSWAPKAIDPAPQHMKQSFSNGCRIAEETGLEVHPKEPVGDWSLGRHELPRAQSLLPLRTAVESWRLGIIERCGLGRPVNWRYHRGDPRALDGQTFLSNCGVSSFDQLWQVVRGRREARQLFTVRPPDPSGTLYRLPVHP